MFAVFVGHAQDMRDDQAGQWLEEFGHDVGLPESGEVIEPIAQDLAAFDVELDPKRVPTFGSIDEGKGRPKRKGPRVSDKGDDYRPPPPPGTGSSPSAPPPPPPADDDTFGDW